MYREKESDADLKGFYSPFCGALDNKNRWVMLARTIPWDEIEKMYADKFSKKGMGAPAKSARMALGALIIQQILCATDEETVLQIQENPYLQYFIGMEDFRTTKPFDPSLMVHFRKRINLEEIDMLNEKIVLNKIKSKINKQKEGDKDKPDNTGKPENANKSVPADQEKKTEEGAVLNSGMLILDATCAPQDIKYPTDLNLLNEAREKTEEVIDILYKAAKEVDEKKRSRVPTGKKREENI